jgi:hypothetical protein
MSLVPYSFLLFSCGILPWALRALRLEHFSCQMNFCILGLSPIDYAEFEFGSIEVLLV